jgi:hypothetical protein
MRNAQVFPRSACRGHAAYCLLLLCIARQDATRGQRNTHFKPATAMFRLSKLFLTLFAVLAVGQSASADDWMFHGSAYSYSPRWGREVGADRFSRGPYYTSQFGGVVRSGYRNLNSNLGGGWGRGGGTWDHNSVFESWYQMSGQYSY